MTTYSGEDIFQMVLQMEDDGQSFYQTIAEQCTDNAMIELCRKLAVDEEKHAHKFAKMRDALLKEPKTRRLNWTWDEMSIFQELIEKCILPDRGEIERLSSENNLTELINRAIEIEQNSITFYTKMMSKVDPGDGKAIEEIIDQEKNHIERLQNIKGQMETIS